MRDYSDEIRNMMYPVRLTAHVSQLIAVKMYRIDEEHREESAELERRRDLRTEDTKSISELPTADRAQVLEYLELEERMKALRTELGEKYSWWTKDTVTVKRSDEEMKRRSKEREEEYRRLTEKHTQRRKALHAVALKMAEAHIAAVKSKVPKDLIDSLEAV